MKAAARSIDFLLCTVNVQLDWAQYMRILRPNGVLCFVGIVPGKIEVASGHFTSLQKTITGGSIGSRHMTREMLDFSARNNILPQIEVVSMREVNAALDKVRANQMRYRMVLAAD
jgi:D-arabinose 1-dehydrogenase-like Zn-dependent alcohol dehydrogenase